MEIVGKKSWKEFRETGLVLIINQILHVFGWAIVFTIDDESGEIVSVYPARVKYRGFYNESVTKNYRKVTQYMVDNAEELKK